MTCEQYGNSLWALRQSRRTGSADCAPNPFPNHSSLRRLVDELTVYDVQREFEPVGDADFIEDIMQVVYLVL
jgi:hypothetical protein